MVDERVCINNFCVFNLLWFGFERRVIKTRENTAGRPALIVEERAAELAYFFRENYQASLLAAAYRNGLSCFCVLELYFDVDWHGVALLFCLCFYSVAKLGASTARIVSIFCSRHRFFLWDGQLGLVASSRLLPEISLDQSILQTMKTNYADSPAPVKEAWQQRQ